MIEYNHEIIFCAAETFYCGAYFKEVKMSLDPKRKAYLESLCRQFRIDVIETLHSIQTGHPGGSLSVCEILTAIFFEKARFDAKNPKWPGRDRVVLSKGHAAPMLYRILAELEFFPKEDLKTLRQAGSHLQGHPSPNHTPGIEIPTGPLGFGYSAALGMALAQRLDYPDAYTYAILGDGETNEGIVWEAAMSASKFKADNFITILDNNHVQLDGPSNVIMPMGDIHAKWSAFGYNVIHCNGHDVEDVCDAIDLAKQKKGMPSIIIAETVKGKGVSFMEGNNKWHGSAIDDESYKKAMAELKGGASDA